MTSGEASPRTKPTPATTPELVAPATAEPANGVSPRISPDAEFSEGPAEPTPILVRSRSTGLLLLVILGVIAFLYFARPAILPIVLACMAAITLKPLMRWLAFCRMSPPIGAAVVLAVVLAVLSTAVVQIGRPAVGWMNDAPYHVMQLRQRIDKLVASLPRFGQAAAAVSTLSEATAPTKDAHSEPIPVAVKDNSSTTMFVNWTSIFLEGTLETLILLYLLLASGDLPLQKLVRVMPTWQDKKRAVDISHEIQRSISDYLFTVSLINAVLGTLVSIGLHWLGVPNATMWGLVVALCNFVPYFGPFVGIIVLGVVGVLTFDTLGKGMLPGAWYFTLHLIEANFVTPILLGRRFLLNPVVIFISLIFWTWLWGIPGALLSVPILVSLKVICERVPSLNSVSELLTK